MLDMHSLTERLFYTNRRTYSVEKGEVAYLDGTPLKRPLSMPTAQKLILAIFVVIALVIGFMFIDSTILDAMRQSQRQEEAIASNLQRQASLETIPALPNIVNMSDDDIRATFNDAGFAYYDASALTESESMVLYRLPSDVNIEDAAVMYAQGIGSLSADQATKLLVGSWRLDTDRTNGTVFAIHYADFSTNDPQIAVRNALEKEGFDATTVTESGVDDSGNTYSMGTFDADGTICSWKISALPLDEMYSVSGMPEDACYVGIRATVQ